MSEKDLVPVLPVMLKTMVSTPPALQVALTSVKPAPGVTFTEAPASQVPVIVNTPAAITALLEWLVIVGTVGATVSTVHPTEEVTVERFSQLSTARTLA